MSASPGGVNDFTPNSNIKKSSVRLTEKANTIRGSLKDRSTEKGPRILIVDDIFFNVDILKDVLSKVHKIDIKKDLVEAYNGK